MADKTTGTIETGSKLIPILNRKNPPINSMKESIMMPKVVDETAFFTVSASLIRDKISPVFLVEKKLNGKCKRWQKKSESKETSILVPKYKIIWLRQYSITV